MEVKLLQERFELERALLEKELHEVRTSLYSMKLDQIEKPAEQSAETKAEIHKLEEREDILEQRTRAMKEDQKEALAKLQKEQMIEAARIEQIEQHQGLGM
jgi:hypothetical protein